MQWVGFSRSLCTPLPGNCVHQQRAHCRRHRVRLRSSLGPAATDAPPKRNPGTPEMKIAEPAQPAAQATEPEPQKKQSSKKDTSEPLIVEESDDEDRPRPFFPAPWEQLTCQEILRQNIELKKYQQQQDQATGPGSEAAHIKMQARDSQTNAYAHRDPVWLELENKIFTKTLEGWGLACCSQPFVCLPHVQDVLYALQYHYSQVKQSLLYLWHCNAAGSLILDTMAKASCSGTA